MISWLKLAAFWLPLLPPPQMDPPHMTNKNLFPQWTEFFKIKIPPSFRGVGHQVQLQVSSYKQRTVDITLN